MKYVNIVLLGLDELNRINNISFAPNPTSDIHRIKLPAALSAQAEIVVMDLFGKNCGFKR